jgi:hypothetical protein
MVRFPPAQSLVSTAALAFAAIETMVPVFAVVAGACGKDKSYPAGLVHFI